MIIYKGWGLLVLLVPLILSWTVSFLVDSYYGKDFYEKSEWMMPMVFVVSSVFVYWIGRDLNSKPGKILIDPETDEEYELKERHTFFWIPFQYWGFVLFGVAVWIYLTNSGLIYHQS